MSRTPLYRYRAACAKVIDGDTYHLTIDLGFRCAVTIPVRLRGVDTPEMDTKEGKDAREWVRQRLMPQKDKPKPEIVVETYKDRQTFARWVCDVWLDGKPLSDMIIASEHGKLMND